MIHSDVTISSKVIKFLSYKKIKINIIDKYGNQVATFIPNSYPKSVVTLINQCKDYNNEKRRNEIAKALEIAQIFNINSNIKYYARRKNNNELKELSKEIEKEIEYIKNNQLTINQLMLTEARAREKYYSSFNKILNDENFIYTKRTRRPPQDPINALISFGNTILYNEIAKAIEKTTLDIRVGIIHSSNNRATTLNLDFADLFKPIIVDRVIFSLINLKMIRKEKHFKLKPNEVMLNQEGKRLFILAFMDKMSAKTKVHGKEYTYRQLIEREIYGFLNYTNENKKYKPYRDH